MFVLRTPGAIRIFPAIILIGLVSLSPVFAGNAMAGTWRAAGGYKVHIPDGPENFELVFETSKGQRIVHPAHWVTRGSQFTWVDKLRTQHTATLDPKNPDQIRDFHPKYPKVQVYWRRMK